MIFNLLNSVRLMADACESFNDNCAEALEPNTDAITKNLNNSLMLVAALNPHIGYDNAAKIAKKAHADGTSLKEAALSLGASPIQTFKEITLPLLTPAILAGMLFSFTISFDDVTATLFWATASMQTVPVKIFGMLRNSISPEINALGTVMIVLTIATPLLAGYLSRKFSRGT